MASHNARDLTETIGDCGRFQVFLTLAVHAGTTAAVCGFLFMAFGAYNPGWTCSEKDINMNIKYNHSNSYSISYVQEKHNVSNWGFDCDVKKKCKSLFYNDESSTAVTEWDLTCDLAWVPSIIISLQMTGALIGSYCGGQIGDRFGRKVSLYLHVAGHGICHVLSIFSISWQMYATIFFFIGFFAGGIVAITYTFPLEFTNSWWRGVIVSLPVWSINFLIFTVIVSALRDWKHVHIFSAVISGLVFLTVFWTPESVRWLAVSGKIDKAKNVVAKISRINKRPCPDTNIIDDIADEEKARMGNHTYTVLDLFRIPVLRSYSIKFGIIWLTMSYTYYGIAFGIKALSGDFYVNLLLSSLLEIPGTLFIAPVINKLGRRSVALIFFAIQVSCCIALLMVFFVASESVKNMSILILALFCKMIIVAVWGVFNVYSSELYPTVVRTIHLGYLSAISRLGSTASPFLIPNDPEKIFIAFITAGIIGVINFILVWTLPEPREGIMMDTTESTTLKRNALPDTGEDCLTEDLQNC